MAFFVISNWINLAKLNPLIYRKTIVNFAILYKNCIYITKRT